MGDISRAKLEETTLVKSVWENWWVTVQIFESFLSSDNFIWRLTALKLMGNFAMLFLALVTST